jgi:hypothetical protein
VRWNLTSSNASHSSVLLRAFTVRAYTTHRPSPTTSKKRLPRIDSANNSVPVISVLTSRVLKPPPPKGVADGIITGAGVPEGEGEGHTTAVSLQNPKQLTPASTTLPVVPPAHTPHRSTTAVPKHTPAQSWKELCPGSPGLHTPQTSQDAESTKGSHPHSAASPSTQGRYVNVSS